MAGRLALLQHGRASPRSFITRKQTFAIIGGAGSRCGFPLIEKLFVGQWGF